jgi:hypothetical protein
MDFKANAAEHGLGGAAARAVPLLGDVLTIYDLGGELANKIETEALDEEASNLQAINGGSNWANARASMALSNALNRVLWVVSVPTPGALDLEAFRLAFQKYFNTAQKAYLDYWNNVLTAQQLIQALKTAEQTLENDLHTITGDQQQIPPT